MWRSLARQLLSDLRYQKTRVLLTVISIIWGTMSVVLLLAFGFGLEKRMAEGQLNFADAIVRIYGGETSESYRGLPMGRNIYLHMDDIELLRENLPLIEYISPSFGKNLRVSRGEKRTTTYGEAVAPSFLYMRHMYPRQGGRFINDGDIVQRRRVVFIGDEIADELFGNKSPVGETIKVDDLPYTVIGVMQPKLQTSMNNGPDSRRVIMPYTTFSTVYARNWVSNIMIRPAVKARTKEMIKNIRYLLGSKYRFNPADENAVRIYDFIEMEEIARKIFLGINIFFGVIGALTLIVAGVGVANIMYVVVKERTHELGIRRAVGARRGHIISHYMGESFMLTCGSGALGILFSLVIIWLVGMAPVDSGVMKYMGHPIFSWPIAVVAVTILTVIALLAGIFPARQAAEVDPVEALRYE
ncbi:MAG: FtsX-like permease family protein [Candidatus Latescibacteria bacterium]|nr:FtsX-like permease family protein [bacterium]MBD3423410.1 FtsX-like permease family protein [Candidatus Latescibacterota bacterium]